MVLSVLTYSVKALVNLTVNIHCFGLDWACV